MKKLTFSLMLMALGFTSLTACRAGEKEVSGAYAITAGTFETTCLGVGSDGTQTMRVWGQGSSRTQAIEQAKKNALETVLFKGIKSQGPCASNPMLPEVNAKERHLDYFNHFFAAKGPYRDFVKETKGGTENHVKAKGASQEAYAITVTVNIPALRQQMINDGLLAE